MGAGLPRHAIELGDRDRRIRELEERLSKTIHEQDGAAQSANTFVCRTEQLEQENAKLKDQNAELEARARQHKIWYENELAIKEKLKQENAKLRDELAEIEAATVPSGQYLDVVARYDKLRAELVLRMTGKSAAPTSAGTR